MTISMTEVGELLTALGELLRGAKSTEPIKEPDIAIEPPATATEAGTFEEVSPTTTTTTIEAPDVPQPPAEDMTAKRIAELEAELMKVRGQSAMLGLQPIKLATNNTEVTHG